jgi:SAM-dependent methyltransferase
LGHDEARLEFQSTLRRGTVDEKDYHEAFWARESGPLFDRPAFAAVHSRVARRIGRELKKLGRPSVLSLGCGDGRIEVAIVPLCARVVGVELAEAGAAAARDRAAAAGVTNAEFHAGDARDAARLAGADRFDAVLSLALLHHLEPGDRAGVLCDARGLLRPKGLFVSHDPNRQRAVNLLKPLVRRRYAETHSPDEGELDPGELTRTALAAGFSSVRTEPADWFAGPMAWVFPSLPRALVAPAFAVDNLLLSTPGLGRLGSSFWMFAVA